MFQDELLVPRRQKLKKNWTENPRECVSVFRLRSHYVQRIYIISRAKRTMEEIFDGVYVVCLFYPSS